MAEARGDQLIAINLHGACVVRVLQGGGLEVSGSKHKALFALLATAPHGRRTRAFVQETLWGVADYDSGHQNLRRALADLRKLLGPMFDELVKSTTTDLTLDLSRVALLSKPEDGLFLEGIEVRTHGFLRWLDEMRTTSARSSAAAAEAVPPTRRKPLGILPTIAVLPFRTTFGPPDHAILGDWLAEECCRALSRSHFLAVISHLSARELARDGYDIELVRDRLQADYCLTGRLRADGAELLLDVDLVSCETGHLLLTRQYQLPTEKPFEPGLAAVGNIVETVGRQLTEHAITEVGSRAITAIEDHRLVIAAVGLMHRAALRDFARARPLLEEAVARAPGTPEIYGWLGKWYVLSAFNQWSTDPAADTTRALDWTAHGLDLAPTNGFCLSIDGFAQNNLRKRLDLASERYELALAHNPSEALCWVLRGALWAFQDRGEEAVAAAQRARRPSPIDPFGYFYDTLSASAHLSAGDYETALALARRSLTINDRHISSYRTMIAAQHYLGRRQEARATAKLLMQRQPHFTIEDYRRSHPAAEFDVGRRVITALAASGIR